MTEGIKPQWIEQMYPPKRGRDHLGLGSVSADQILAALSPGINVLTPHPRYHSFYTFLLHEFWKRRRLRSHKAWMQFYRPREFIFSLGAYLCEHKEHGGMDSIVGGQKTAPLARERRDTYNTAFNYIRSDLGGYGLYYRSVIIQLGLIYPGGPGFPYPIDVPSEFGKEVATAFCEAVKNTTYYRDYFDVDNCEVPIDVVHEYIGQACLCQLQLPDTPDRSLLLEAFLHGGPQVESEARRATLRLLLDIAHQTNGHPVNEEGFRQLLYFGHTYHGAAYEPQEVVRNTHRKWRLYQAREYYAFALNAMWCYLCDWGLLQAGDVQSVPLSSFWDHLDTALDFDHLAVRLNASHGGIGTASDFNDLLRWLKRVVGAEETAFDASCTIDSPIHEHRLHDLAVNNPEDPEVMVAGMLTILALILLRFDEPALCLKPEWEISRMGAEGRLSVDGFIKSVRRMLQNKPQITIGEIARWLYADYIMLQHQFVATGKLPDNTFRFVREGDQIRFYRLWNRLSFMDSRFDALSRTVHELGLCGDLYLPNHPLTPDGYRLLAQGDLA